MVDTGFGYVIGTPSLEVFSVSVSKQGDGDRRSELYGTIRVTDGHGINATLYDRNLHNSESINPNETLTLRGPVQGVSLQAGFTIHLNLKDVNQDLEIKDGKICFDSVDDLFYDKKLSIEVPGLNGFATVRCAIFSVAIQANVNIVLCRKDQSDGDSDIHPDVDIYGTIVAFYGEMFDYSGSDQSRYYQTTLFRQPQRRPLKISLGQAIPLLRSVVNVPACSSLVFEATLFRSDTKEQILQGATAKLLPTIPMECEISGGSHLARLDVSWYWPSCEEDFE